MINKLNMSTIRFIIVVIMTLSFVETGFAQNTSVVDPLIKEPTFDRYSKSWACGRTSGWREIRFWRDKLPDTTYYPPTGHPTQKSTDSVVAKCVSHMSLGTTAQRDLLGLVEAHLGAEQIPQADAAAAKLLNLVASSQPKVKAWALYQLVSLYLGDAEPKLVKAEQFIKQLDAMGEAAALERMFAHQAAASTGSFRDSIPLWDRELNAALAASKQITGDMRKEYEREIGTVYHNIARLKIRLNDVPGALAILTQAGKEVSPAFAPRGDEYSKLGKPAAQIQAARWFNTNGNNIHPAPGKPALVWFVYPNCDNCYGEYAMLKRLRAKFEAKGLDIILVTRTGGYFRSRLVKPDSEMVLIGQQFTKELDLPVNLAIWQVELMKRDDGRVVPRSAAPNESAYGYGGVFLVDAKGNLRMQYPALWRIYEATMTNVIAEMLSK